MERNELIIVEFLLGTIGFSEIETRLATLPNTSRYRKRPCSRIISPLICRTKRLSSEIISVGTKLFSRRFPAVRGRGERTGVRSRRINEERKFDIKRPDYT